MRNAARSFRETLGLNQADFGRLIGRSLQSVAAYERGQEIPGEVLDKMRQLALEHGLPSIAAELHAVSHQERLGHQLRHEQQGPPGTSERGGRQGVHGGKRAEKDRIPEREVGQEIDELLSLRSEIEELLELERKRRHDLLTRLSSEPPSVDLLGRVLRLLLS